MTKTDTAFGIDFSEFLPNFGTSFGFPSLNADAILDLQKKNLEAFDKAGKLTATGFEELLKRQGEMLKLSVKEFESAVKATTKKGLPEFNPEKQTEAVQASFDGAVANSRELMELAATSGQKIFDVISKRANEAVAEAQTVVTAAKA